MQQEQVEVPEPLVLKDIMQGLESLYDSAGVLRFTVTHSASAKTNAQAIWLARKMPEWVKLLNQHSGAVVVSSRTKFEVKRNEFCSSGYLPQCDLIVELALSGGLKLKEIKDEELRKNQSGQIKKILAQRVLEKFPPPFNTQYPGFSANWPVRYYMQVYHPFHLKFKKLDTKEVIENLKQKILQLDGELVEFKEHEFSEKLLLTIVWLEDVEMTNCSNSHSSKLSEIYDFFKKHDLNGGWLEILERP